MHNLFRNSRTWARGSRHLYSVFTSCLHMRFSNFIGDPFAISTVSFGGVSWIVAIAGAAALEQLKFPRFTWWGLVYEILVVLLIFVLYLFNTIELYKFTLVGLLSIAFLYTTNSVNNLIYNSGSLGNLCCAAGCILLLIVNVLWIVYFGGHPESPTNQLIDSFSVKYPGHAHVPVEEPKANYMLLLQLNGLENFSTPNVGEPPAREASHVSVTHVGEIVESLYRYKAKALYLYDANPEDANEISFVKGEIMEVDDIDGKWWQARRLNGQTGICPSNYVKLLD